MSLIDRRQGLWGLAALGVAATLPIAWRRAQAAAPTGTGTLALVEIIFAQIVSRKLFGQGTSAREWAGIGLMIFGVVLLVSN